MSLDYMYGLNMFPEEQKRPPRPKNILEKKFGSRYSSFLYNVLLESIRDMLLVRDLASHKITGNDLEVIKHKKGNKKDLEFKITNYPDGSEFKKIEEAIQKGQHFPIEIKPLHYNSATALEGGAFYEVTISINSLKPKVFVKVFPNKKTYRVSKQVQNIVSRCASNVPGPRHYDDKLKVVAFPFIEGKTLFEEFQSYDGDQLKKQKTLKKAIDILTNVYAFGSKEKFSDISLDEITDTTNSLLKKFFFATNRKIKKQNTTFNRHKSIKDKSLEDLLAQYKKDIAQKLDDSNYNRLIQGDAHLRNFIVSNDELHLTDFDLARFGKLQLDLYKLFEKSGVLLDNKLKKHLLEYAFNKFKRTGSSCPSVDKQEFMETYCATETHEFLISAARCLAFSEDPGIAYTFSRKGNLEDAACLYYTRALDNMRKKKLTGLASMFEKYVDMHYQGVLHKLSPQKVRKLKHLPDDSMLSTLLSDNSLNEVERYTRAKKKAKLNQILKTGFKSLKIGVPITGGGALLALMMYTARNAPDMEQALDTALYNKIKSIEDFMIFKGDAIYGTVIYNEDLQEDVFVKNSEQLYKTLRGQNNTILSDKEFRRLFNKKKGGTAFNSSLAKYYASQKNTDPDALSALVYATVLDTPERKELLGKGRLGHALVTPGQIREWSGYHDSSKEDVKELFSSEFQNLMLASRVLGYYLMQTNGEVHTAFADYFFGEDKVTQAMYKAENNDINQYFRYLPDGPEKTLLLKAMTFYNACRQEKHNEYILSKEWPVIKGNIIERDLLLWEYADKTFGQEGWLPGKEMIKTPEYEKFLEKYKNKELALIACYDEKILERAIQAASKTHVNTVFEFIPATLRDEAVLTLCDIVDGYIPGYGYRH